MQDQEGFRQLVELAKRQANMPTAITQAPVLTEDMAETKMTLFEKNGRLTLDFGRSIHWISFEPGQARELARTLMRWANSKEPRSGKRKKRGRR